MAYAMKVYNNLTRSKVPFKTVKEGEVRFYSCGPTTYDFLHVGNARALVVGDIMHRVFRVLGYDVTYVRNFTDVDDKIIQRANERGVDPLVHADQYVKECQTDMRNLNMIDPTHTPKVSETMDEIIEMIKGLISKKSAYEVDGEVFYDVPSFQEYGKLSKKKIDDLEHGRRVEVDVRKHHPSDFVLWKPAKEGEPSWDSPWGKGRPGWHIECSAMSKKFLGETLDIHHGGVDLMFPHHENEIAQSEAANGKTYCTHWCHNEFLNFGSVKMSKSLGNVITIRDFCNKYSGDVLRQILTSVHYRSKMEWTEDVIERAINDVERIHQFVINFNLAKEKNRSEDVINEKTEDVKELVTLMKNEISNDFNITGAMGRFFTFVREINRLFLDGNGNFEKKEKLSGELILNIENVIQFLKDATGLVHDDAEETLEVMKKARKALKADDSTTSDEEIEGLIEQRKEARKNKDWAKADEIRDKFKELKIEVKDNSDGSTSWKYN